MFVALSLMLTFLTGNYHWTCCFRLFTFNIFVFGGCKIQLYANSYLNNPFGARSFGNINPYRPADRNPVQILLINQPYHCFSDRREHKVSPLLQTNPVVPF